MDENYNIGSVACLEHIKNPISVARAVMEKTPHVMLVGDGALQFAFLRVSKRKPSYRRIGKRMERMAENKPV
jgi:N4-(beta-N-acetylglucosaminyl)-L-asparaginase